MRRTCCGGAGIEPRCSSGESNGADPGLPLRARTDLVTRDWNIVYMPYCTGDVHIGNQTATYSDATGGQPPLTWKHAGYTNTTAAIAWAHSQFPRGQQAAGDRIQRRRHRNGDR